MTTIEILEQEGYRNLREVPGLGMCGVYDMLFTVGVFVGLNEEGYDFRYCFPKELPGEAEKALSEWNGEGHIGGPWIKCKGKGAEILNPNYEKIFKKSRLGQI